VSRFGCMQVQERQKWIVFENYPSLSPSLTSRTTDATLIVVSLTLTRNMLLRHAANLARSCADQKFLRAEKLGLRSGASRPRRVEVPDMTWAASLVGLQVRDVREAVATFLKVPDIEARAG
jgi:hypothetical protein